MTGLDVCFPEHSICAKLCRRATEELASILNVRGRPYQCVLALFAASVSLGIHLTLI